MHGIEPPNYTPAMLKELFPLPAIYHREQSLSNALSYLELSNVRRILIYNNNKTVRHFFRVAGGWYPYCTRGERGTTAPHERGSLLNHPRHVHNRQPPRTTPPLPHCSGRPLVHNGYRSSTRTIQNDTGQGYSSGCIR